MRVELHRNENAGGKTTVTLEQRSDGSLQIFYHDVGDVARRTFGDADYEAWLTIPAGQLSKLAFALLAERYGDRPTALSDLRSFCGNHQIATESGVWT